MHFPSSQYPVSAGPSRGVRNKGLIIISPGCVIAFDDPYAMAVMVTYLAKEFDVVRVKNRFEDDEVEEVTAEKLYSEFTLAETLGEGSAGGEAGSEPTRPQASRRLDKMYRDILINLRPKGSKFICEVQLTLTGISILKKSEQKIYSLMRMTSATELLGSFVFSERRADNAMQHSLDAPADAKETAALLSDSKGPDGDARATPLSRYPEVKAGEDTVTSQTAVMSLGDVSSTMSTPADSYGNRVEKPLPGVMKLEARPAGEADFQQDFFTCACKPCSPELRVAQAELPEVSGIALSEVTVVVPCNEEHVGDVRNILSL